MQDTKSRKKILVPVVAGALAAAVGLGAFATFTSSDTRVQSVATGTVVVAISDTAFTGKVADAVANMAAGDTRQRSFNVANTSTLPLAVLTLTVGPNTGHEADALITNANGLTISVETCDQAYTETANQTVGLLTNVSTFACGGTADVVATNVTLTSVAPQDLTNGNALYTGANTYVKSTLTLPQAASNALQGLTTEILYSVFAQQRVAQNI